MSHRLPGVALLVFVVAFPLGAASATPLPVVEQFWQSYSRGDVDAAMSLWDPRHSARVRDVLERENRLQCVRVQDAAIRVSPAGVEVDATVVRTPASGGNAQLEREHYLATVRSTADEWRIVSWDRREDLLADDLVRAPEADRAGKLAAQPALRTRRLAIALSRWIALLSNRQRLAEAAAILDLARSVAEGIDDDAARSTVLGAETVFLRKQPSPDIAAAIEAGEEAERLALQSGDENALAHARMRLARVLEGVDQPRAESLLLGILASEEKVTDTATLAFAASQMSWTTGGRLESATGFRYAILASYYAELSGDPSARLNASLNLAGSFRGVGDLELARVYYEKTRVVARETNSIAGEATALFNLATILWPEEPDAQAPDVYGQALDVANCGGAYADALVVPLLWLGADRAIIRNDLDAAWTDIRAAHARMYRSVIDERHSGSILIAEANVLLREKKPQEALLVLEEVRALHDAYPQWRWEHFWSRPAASALRSLKQRDEAIAVLHNAISMVEQERANLPSDPYVRQKYLSYGTALYLDLIALLVETGEVGEALVIAEQIASRSLQDVLDADGQRRRPRSPAIERAEREIVRLNRMILTARPDDPALARNRERLAEARLHLNDVITREASALEPVDLMPRAPLDLRRIGPKTAVLRLVVAEQQTIAFVVRRDQRGVRLSSHVLPVSRRELDARVRVLLAKLEARDLDYATASLELYRLLIQPLGKDLAGITRLSVVPDDPLWQLPFQTLLDEQGRHLLDRFEISYAPSVAWSLRGEREPRAPESILAIGDPEIGGLGRAMVRALVPGSTLGRLPDAAREARDVGGLYPRSRVLIGDAASEPVLKREMAGYDIVHFATHALVDEMQPRYSSIVLAAPRASEEDGLLEARELDFLDLDAQLVVLSACNTARGRGYAGEGVVGLAWTLLSKGVRHAVVSQWKADSKATSALMVSFHRHLASGDSPAAAMRKAQFQLRRDPRYEDPLYWAAFVVLGAP